MLWMAAAGVSLLTACQTIETISMDYMLPAEVSFPEELKRVAVVNNSPVIKPEQTLIEEKGSEKSFWGDSKRATEALANALAEGNYFDEVIICDSLLRATDSQPAAHPLTLEEINQLTHALDVDFLISLEGLIVKTKRDLQYLPEWRVNYGTIDAKVYATTRIYLPNRPNAMATLHSNDSIFWEESALHESDLRRLLPDDVEVQRQASDFAGSLPVQQLLPHWKSAQRYLYGGSSVNLRDALVYVRENDWTQAIDLWKKEYEVKNVKRKKAAAYNLSVGYEMQDQMEEAVRWIGLALQHTQPETTEQLMMQLYQQELKQRLGGMQRLQLQTRRLNP